MLFVERPVRGAEVGDHGADVVEGDVGFDGRFGCAGRPTSGLFRLLLGPVEHHAAQLVAHAQLFAARGGVLDAVAAAHEVAAGLPLRAHGVDVHAHAAALGRFAARSLGGELLRHDQDHAVRHGLVRGHLGLVNLLLEADDLELLGGNLLADVGSLFLELRLSLVNV